MKIFVDAFRNRFFVYFFLLCLCDNLLGRSGVMEMVMTAGLVALVAYGESLLTTAWSKLTDKWWLYLPLILFGVIDNALLLADGFIYFTFGRVLDPGIMDIVLETTPQESSEFLHTYLTLGRTALGLLMLGAVNVLCWWVASRSKTVRKPLTIMGVVLIVLGLGVSTKCVIGFVKYRNGEGIPQLTSYTRVAYSGYIAWQNVRGVRQLEEMADDFAPERPETQAADIILIIGESHSLFHSSLYDYGRDTNPLLRQRRDSGELVVFRDAVTIDDHTHTVMHSLYSVGVRGEVFFTNPILPMIMHKAGYRTTLLDNQYILNNGGGISFLTSQTLSDKVFDHRNAHAYQYDGEMLDELELSDSQSDFAILHLMGQHYLYQERYPPPISNR